MRQPARQHRKQDLLEKVVLSINESGWNVLFIEDVRFHPFVIRIYRDSISFNLRIYIWNLTHGGGSARPTDEYRIQITGVDQFEKNPNEKTLILGWWREVGVFAGFDFNRHALPLGYSPSIQIREEALRLALLNGFAPSDKGNGEIAIAFRPDFFCTYVEELEQLHSFGNSQVDFTTLQTLAQQPLVLNDQILQHVSTQRQTTLVTLNKKLRDSSFKARVLNAYGNRCAFSGMQLQLIDAAHIVPVSSDHSTDDTSNGIALSALYHRAYDKGLVTFNDQYQTLINEDAMARFRAAGLDGGEGNFRDGLRPVIIVPPTISDRPNVNLIQEANQLRGWN